MAMTIVAIVNSFGMPGVVIPNGAGEPHDLKMNVRFVVNFISLIMIISVNE